MSSCHLSGALGDASTVSGLGSNIGLLLLSFHGVCYFFSSLCLSEQSWLDLKFAHLWKSPLPTPQPLSQIPFYVLLFLHPPLPEHPGCAKPRFLLLITFHSLRAAEAHLKKRSRVVQNSKESEGCMFIMKKQKTPHAYNEVVRLCRAELFCKVVVWVISLCFRVMQWWEEAFGVFH